MEGEVYHAHGCILLIHLNTILLLTSTEHGQAHTDSTYCPFSHVTVHDSMHVLLISLNTTRYLEKLL